MPGRIASLFRNLMRRKAVEQALNDELHYSLELLTEEKIKEGLAPSEARRQAHIELGGVEQVSAKVRDIRVGRLLEDFASDLRFAFRTMAKSPGYTAAIIVSLALGIAATATVFSIANGLLWGVLPVRDPARMVKFSEGQSFSPGDYLDYRDQTSGVFEGGVVAHYPVVPASLGGAGATERIWGEVVSGNYFSVAGIRMALGRGILPEEDRDKGRGNVVVLSESLWRRHFGADPGIVGRDVILNGRHYSVIGIAPASFHGLERIMVSDFWVPLSMVDEILPGFTTPGGGSTDRRKSWLILDARLSPGVSRTQAAAAVNVVKQRLDATYRKDQKRHEAVTLTDAGGLPGASNFPAVALMTVLMALAGLVLMVACANAANLLLARATARHREMGVRLALGAGRWRLIRQLLTESLLLALAGAGVGFLLAMSAARALSSFRLPLPLPVVFDFNVDFRVVEFTIGVSLLTTLLFGLAPALRSTRLELTRALKQGAAGSTPREHSRMRKTLVVVQVSLSLVLLTIAGLFLRSLQKSFSMDVGFDTSNLLVLRVDPQLQNYPPEKTLQFFSQLRDRALALPGVRSVSYVDILPLTLVASSYDFSVEAAGNQQAQRVSADLRRVFSGYFQTMGIPFLSGHDFDSNASQRGASVVIDKTMADRLFPNQDPIGRVVHAGKESYTVIGVVRSANSRTAGERPMECAYLYLDGKSLNLNGTSVLIKTAVDPRQLERPMREQIAELDPDLAVFNTVTMQEQFTQALLVPRAMAWLLGCFGAVGLTLGTIGLYGVMSYSVHRRIPEIGVRMAMGARRGAVVGMILRQGLTLTGVGVIIGLALAVVIGRLAAGFLYGVSGTDLITFLIVPTVLTLVACAANVIPAHRAALVDPVVALRNE